MSETATKFGQLWVLGLATTSALIVLAIFARVVLSHIVFSALTVAFVIAVVVVPLALGAVVKAVLTCGNHSH